MSSIRDTYRDKARFGYHRVKQIINHDKATSEKFKSHVKNIPMYIYTNGLIAALTFILKKSQGAGPEAKSYKEIGQIIIDYFSKHTVFKKIEVDKLEDLINQLIEAEQKDYIKYTTELISLLEWVVKFSEGMIEDDRDNKESVLCKS